MDHGLRLVRRPFPCLAWTSLGRENRNENDDVSLDQENWEDRLQPKGDGTMSWRKITISAVDCACPSQKLNLGADHTDLVLSRGRGEQIRWQDIGAS